MTRYHLIVCLPLLAAIVAGLFGRRIGDAAAMAVTCGAVIIGAVLSWVAFYLVIGHEQVVTVKVLDWIYSGGFQVDWALKIDQLTAVKIGRASCRERVCQYVYISVGADALKKKKKKK